MTLARRLRLASVATLAAALALAALATWTVVRWQRAVASLGLASEYLVLAERLRADLFRQVNEVNDWLFYGYEEPAGEPRPFEGSASFDDALAHLEAWPDADRAEVAELRALRREVGAVREAVLDLLGRGEAGEARELMERTVQRRLFQRFDAALADVDRFYHRQAEDAVVEIERVTRRAGLLVAGIVGLAALQAAALLVGAHRYLLRPLERLGRGVERIGAGALDHRIPADRADEVGALAARINEMAAALEESRTRQVRVERLAAVGELAPYLAHNLRNPLASIRSAAQVAREELAAGEPGAPGPAAGLLRDIVETTDRLEGWVERILVSIRPVRLDPAAHAVGPILEELVGILRLAASRRGVSLVLEVAADLPPARIDREAVTQALAAVVTNAIEASPRGGAVRVRAAPAAPAPGAKAGASIAVSVADEGPGVPDALRGRLFTPAFSTKRDGRGIGLWLARSVVESHGGTIGLEPGEPRGTVVRIMLPAS